MCGKPRDYEDQNSEARLKVKRDSLLVRLPSWLRNQVFSYAEDLSKGDSGDPFRRDDTREAVTIEKANVITSAVDEPYGSFYRPVLDIDFFVHVVPSSTPGKYHLFLDKVLTRKQYTKLLNALADAGIIEDGFAARGVGSRFGTAVRLPWIKKGQD